MFKCFNLNNISELLVISTFKRKLVGCSIFNPGVGIILGLRIMGYRILSVISLFILLAGNIVAQNTNVDYLTVDNGLSNNLPEDFYQDSTGYIWIATESGLNRYDGFNVKQFFSDPADSNTLNHNTVYSICPINGNSFFLATYNGVSVYNPDQENFSNVKFKVDGNEIIKNVTKIIKTKDGSFLAASDKGIFKYSKSEGIFLPYNFNLKNSFVEEIHATVLFEDNEQNIWIGTYGNGLFLYNKKLNVISEMQYMIGNQNQLERNKILLITQDMGGNIWIATEKGAYRYSANNVLKRYTTSDNLPDNFVYSIYRRLNGELLFAAGPNGLSKFDPITDRFIQLKGSIYSEIAGDLVTVIFEDKQGNLWIGTQQSGVFIFKFQELIFTSIQSSDLKGKPEMNDFVLSVTEDHSGKIWIGTNGAGINIVDPGTKLTQNINSKIANTIGENYIQTILEDRNDNVWIGTYLGGVTKFNSTTRTFERYHNVPGDRNSLINDIVNFVYEDSKGNIWILTHEGLSRYLVESNNFINYKTSTEHPISTNFATCMVEDDDDLWIGTYNGLFKFNQKTETLKTYVVNKTKGNISDDLIYSLLKDSKGRIWVGTFNGLNLYNKADDSFIIYTKSNGLPDNLIEGILEDNFGNLWLSTSTGLSRFDNEKKLFLNFSKKDGLMHNVFQHGAFCKTVDGKLLFGSKSGLVMVNPNELKKSGIKPKIVLTEFKLFENPVFPKKGSSLEKPIDETKKIILNYNQSFFSFNFSSLNFTNPNHDNFSCYLDGYDYDWRNLGNVNSITYTKIPPGKYTFNVKVVNKNSLSEATKQIMVVIKPPFWKTKWMYSLYLIFALAFISFIYSFLISRSNYKHSLLIERLEKEKSIEINQSKIKFFINISHEFKTPLTLILSPLEKLIREMDESSEDENHKYLIHLVYNNALRLSRLINQIMDIRKIDAGAIHLKAQPTDIVMVSKNIFNYFQDQAINHHIVYQFNADISENTLWLDNEKFEKIMFNLLSNAFKFTPDFGTITYSISNYDLKTVCLSIKDSGHGIPSNEIDKVFNRFYRVENEKTENSSSSGIGLSIVKEYTELHGGKVKVVSEPDKGAEFLVYLPLGDDHLSEEQKIPYDSKELSSPSEFASFIPVNYPEDVKMFAGKGQNKLPRVLVIEDNYELRKYISDSMSSEFNVFQAADGEEGLNMVSQLLPNLVVCDVMMPGISGFEVCRKIKSDIQTSHIPIILLTVLNSEKNQIDGYECGADAYLTKPFDILVLKARIINILQSRARLRQKFMNELNPDISSISINKVDQNFLSKAYKIVNENLANIEFSAEDFAHEIGVSRSNLHIKLKALTDLSATEFIRNQRLKEAAKQLGTFNYNISEVAYLVGFNNISYFNRCFKKQFGVTPSQFVEEIQNVDKEKNFTT